VVVERASVLSRNRNDRLAVAIEYDELNPRPATAALISKDPVAAVVESTKLFERELDTVIGTAWLGNVMQSAKRAAALWQATLVNLELVLTDGSLTAHVLLGAKELRG